jgi:hypothetical protein
MMASSGYALGTTCNVLLRHDKGLRVMRVSLPDKSLTVQPMLSDISAAIALMAFQRQ